MAQRHRRTFGSTVSIPRCITANRGPQHYGWSSTQFPAPAQAVTTSGKYR